MQVFNISKIAPVALLAHSAAVTSVGASNVYIDHDIWPVRPLSDPRLYLYCQTLPIQYRMNRNIMRAYLHARGLPEAIYQNSGDVFNPFFVSSVCFGLTDLFTDMMQSSVLAGAGFVDAELALDRWRAICANPVGQNADELFGLYCLLVAEINMRLI